jgi:copper chaperone CopZ
MKRIALFLAATTGCFAQWSNLVLHFEGIGCASCIESLPERLKRVRGISTAEVDAAKGQLRIQLAEGNRVRMEQLRDFIGQDGTKVVRAEVDGRGVVDDEKLFRLPGQMSVYRLEGCAAKPGAVKLQGVIAPVLRGQEQMTIQCKSIEPAG